METKNRYYHNLKIAAEILGFEKDKLAVEISKLDDSDEIRTDSHVLILTRKSESSEGQLFHVLIKDVDKKCVLNAPILLLSPKRIKYATRN